MADLFISKTGSSYLVVAFMQASFFDKPGGRELLSLQQEVTQALVADYDYVAFELCLSGHSAKPV